MERDEKFAESLASIFIEVISANSMFSNVYQFLLEYMNSIGNEKIIVRDPFSTIEVTETPQMLHLEIKCVDLLRNVCESRQLPAIRIQGKKSGEIPIFKLFQWGEKNDK